MFTHNYNLCVVYDTQIVNVYTIWMWRVRTCKWPHCIYNTANVQCVYSPCFIAIQQCCVYKCSPNVSSTILANVVLCCLLHTNAIIQLLYNIDLKHNIVYHILHVCNTGQRLSYKLFMQITIQMICCKTA